MSHHWIIICCLLFVSNILQSQNAPVTTATSLYGSVNGPVTIPVKVTAFTGIASISLDLEYDPAVLTYIQGVKNPLLIGSFYIGDNVLPGGNHHIVISWFGSSVSLADGSSIVDLKFTYKGGTTALNWLDNGSSCEYTDAGYNPLNDLPATCYYLDGKVTSDKLAIVTLFLEGLYNTNTNQMNSLPGSSADPCTVAVADQLTVELHNATTYSVIEYSAINTTLDVTGRLQFTVSAVKNGNYYITIRHRSSIATTSAIPVSFSGNTIEYSFLDDAAKAFGNNMKQMIGGKWAIYTGDVNQDNIVDANDMTLVSNAAAAFSTGYLSTDCNGDGIIDASDIVLTDNNAKDFVQAILP